LRSYKEELEKLLFTDLTETQPEVGAKVQRLTTSRCNGHADSERTTQIMLKGLLSLTVAAVLIATSVSAQALTLINRDDTHHTFTIYEEDDEWSVTIQPDQTLTHLCRSGCSIALEHDEERDFDGREIVVIFDGRLLVAR